MTVTVTASTRCSDYGMTCVQCGDSLIAPELVEYFNEERLVLNFWTCTNCGYQFETDVFGLLDAEPISDRVTIETFFSVDVGSVNRKNFGFIDA